MVVGTRDPSVALPLLTLNGCRYSCHHLVITGVRKRATEKGGHTPFKGTVWAYVIAAHPSFSHPVTWPHLAAREAGQPLKCLAENSVTVEENRSEGVRDISVIIRTIFLPYCFIRENFPLTLSSGPELPIRVNQSECICLWDFKSNLFQRLQG